MSTLQKATLKSSEMRRRKTQGTHRAKADSCSRSWIIFNIWRATHLQLSELWCTLPIILNRTIKSLRTRLWVEPRIKSLKIYTKNICWTTIILTFPRMFWISLRTWRARRQFNSHKWFHPKILGTVSKLFSTTKSRTSRHRLTVRTRSTNER